MKISDARLAELETEASGSTADGRLDFDQLEIWSLLAEVRSSRAALANIERAWNDPGAVPSYHERMKRIIQHQWPVLAHAIRRAIA